MPSPYRRILVAIDCSDESAQVLSRAAGVLSGNDGELHLIHVIEPLALAYGADVPMDVTDLQSGLMQQARETADTYASRYQIPADNVHVERRPDRGRQPHPQRPGPATGLHRPWPGAGGPLRCAGGEGGSEGQLRMDN